MVLAEWLPIEKVIIQFWHLFDNFLLPLRGEDVKFDVCFPIIVNSASLACGILIGQLKKKPRESCQKVVKTN